MRYLIAALIIMATMSGCSSMYDADGGWTENQTQQEGQA